MPFSASTAALLLAGWLRWDAPAQCPQADAVQAEIDRLTDTTTAFDVSASATVVPDPQEGLRLSLRIVSPAGTEHRDLLGSDCEALTGAAAVFVATAIDASRTRIVAPPANAEEPEPLSVEAPAPPRIRPDAPPVVPRASASAHEKKPATRLAASYGVGLGLESPWSHGPAVAAAWTWQRVRIGFGARYSVPTTFSPAPRRRVQAQALVVDARGCYRIARGRFEVPVCAVAEGGWYRAAGSGWARNGVVQRPLFGLGVGSGVRIGLGPRRRVAVALDAEAIAPLVFPVLTADGRTTWRPAIVGGRAGLGLEVRVAGAESGGEKK